MINENRNLANYLLNETYVLNESGSEESFRRTGHLNLSFKERQTHYKNRTGPYNYRYRMEWGNPKPKDREFIKGDKVKTTDKDYKDTYVVGIVEHGSMYVLLDNKGHTVKDLRWHPKRYEGWDEDETKRPAKTFFASELIPILDGVISIEDEKWYKEKFPKTEHKPTDLDDLDF